MKITGIILIVVSFILVALVGVYVFANRGIEKVVLDGKSIEIPCAFSEIEKVYDISEYSKSVLNKSIAKGDSEILFLAKDGVENGISVEVCNNQKKATSDIGSCEVRMISIDENADVKVEVFRGLAPGMTDKEVQEALEGFRYNKSEMSGYVFYHVSDEKKEQYYASLVLYEDRVMNVSLYYTDEER